MKNQNFRHFGPKPLKGKKIRQNEVKTLLAFCRNAIFGNMSVHLFDDVDFDYFRCSDQ
jgi:hypothetical protein